MNVGDVMTREVLTVEPTTPLRDVARLLVERSISGVPVCAGGRVVGVISEADFVNKQAHPAADQDVHRLLRTSADDERAIRRSTAITAAEAMSAPAVVVEPGTSLTEAARIMERHGVNRLPVVDGDRLVGILTRADIVRSYVREDDAIISDVEAALHAVEGISVTVQDGVASIVGTVRTPALAGTVVRVAASVPGVVAVDSHQLGWHDEQEPWLAESKRLERESLLAGG